MHQELRDNVDLTAQDPVYFAPSAAGDTVRNDWIPLLRIEMTFAPSVVSMLILRW